MASLCRRGANIATAIIFPIPTTSELAGSKLPLGCSFVNALRKTAALRWKKTCWLRCQVSLYSGKATFRPRSTGNPKKWQRSIRNKRLSDQTVSSRPAMAWQSRLDIEKSRRGPDRKPHAYTVLGVNFIKSQSITSQSIRRVGCIFFAHPDSVGLRQKNKEIWTTLEMAYISEKSTPG